MKVLTLIDSFKGTLSSIELGLITKNVLSKQNHDVTTLAISDGGEGFLDVIEQNNKDVEREYLEIYDPLFRKINSYYLKTKNNSKCYIELAKASGISLLKNDELNPFITSTYGFGQMILDAINKGCKDIILGIGGSCTDDGGSGLLEALGVVFNNGTLVKMNNTNLSKIEKIDTNILDRLIVDVKFTCLSDVVNPLLGENGATYVFARQKGAKEEDLPVLEENMTCFAAFNKKMINEKGSGAAGGVGYALCTYLNAKVVSGIDAILDMINYESLDAIYDYVITGEGKIDSQSMQGKVISSIKKRTKHAKIIYVCAINELDINSKDIYQIVDENVTREMSLNNPKYYYQKLVEKIKL